MIIALVFMYNRVRHKKSTPATFALWVFIWIVLLFFAFAPKISDPLAGFFGFSRGLDLLIVAAFGIVTYAGFRFYVKIDDLNQNMTQLVRELAINNEIQLDDEDNE
ncbi:MAG: DUF2304 domain-containing protein [Methanobrevibacter sp.]|nr:DUF2304 domain-containing protein [Methanobrevibacter sp.]